MSTIQADVYDAPTIVTPNNTGVTDVNGPFTALLVVAAGTIVVYPSRGPLAAGSSTVNLGSMSVGSYIRFPCKAVSSTSSGSCVGLLSPLYNKATG